MIERRLEVGPRGLSLALCEWPGADPAVIVLHGFLEQGAAWDRVARELGRRVVAPDQRGHGRSDAVGAGGWYHFWDYVGDLDAVVRDVGGPVDLVGHSMGGTVASLYAGTCPDQVRRLVLVEGLGPPDSTEFAVARAREYLRDRRAPPTHPALTDLDDAVRRLRRTNTGLDESVARELAARVVRDQDGGLVWTWDALHRGRSPTPFSAAAFAPFLREIRAPTLLVQGEAGWAPADLEQRAAAIGGPVRRSTVAGAGHLVHHDAPGALAALIREFLA